MPEALLDDEVFLGGGTEEGSSAKALAPLRILLRIEMIQVNVRRDLLAAGIRQNCVVQGFLLISAWC